MARNERDHELAKCDTSVSLRGRQYLGVMWGKLKNVGGIVMAELRSAAMT